MKPEREEALRRIIREVVREELAARPPCNHYHYAPTPEPAKYWWQYPTTTGGITTTNPLPDYTTN